MHADTYRYGSTLPSPDAAAMVYIYPRMRPLGTWSKLLRGALTPLFSVQFRRLVEAMEASDFLEGKKEEFLKVGWGNRRVEGWVAQSTR